MHEIEELAVLGAPDSNCRPCPVGKALGRRRCPGLRFRGLLVQFFRGFWRKLRRKG